MAGEMNQLWLASGNAHKLSEISGLLGIRLRSLKELSDPPALEETGTTFEENALIKARGLRDATGQWALADDSGLCVDALGGAPGVYSARFAGPQADDAANNLKLLRELEKGEDRSAAFVCVLALCGPGGEEWVVRGTCRGSIARQPSGDRGFGYDPLFHPEGYTGSFAELGEEVKQRESHRARALQELLSHPDHPLSRFKSA